METKKLVVCFFLIFTLFLSSCEKPLKLEPPLEISPKKEELANQTEEISIKKEKMEIPEKEIVNIPSFEYPKKWETGKLPPAVSEEKKEEKAPIDAKALVGVKGPVILNVENMPFSDFIIYVLGELLKVAFIIDEDVKNMRNPVTLRMPKALPPEEVLQAVVDYLEKFDLKVEQKGILLSITKPKPKTVTPPPPKIESVIIGEEVPETSATIVLFYPLKYIKPNEIDYLIKDIFRTGVDIKTYPKENALYFTGPGYQIKKIIEVIKILDIPVFVDKKLYVIKLTYWDAESFTNQLTDILTKLGYSVAKSVKEPGILLIPIKSLNSLICAFPDEESYKYTLEWIKKLDTPEAAGAEERFYIYKPKFSKAGDLAETLQKLLTGAALPTPSPVQPPKTQETKTPPSPQPLTTTKEYKISADEKRNFLLITATPALYQQILQILKELDKPPRQVLIEATILELTLKDELKMGLEWYIKNRMGGNYTLFQSLGVPTGPGLTYTFISDTERFNVLINMFAAKGLTNILSTPRLMVLDNQEATIQVGTDVPVVTGEVATAEAVTGATAGIVRSIQYRSTGIILRVKPTIYAEDMLQLDITQEVSEMGAAPPGIESPTILIRRINSTVIAGNTQTIVLGGLISTTRGKEESKVPFLGDIPLLGNLFKAQTTEERKTELLILLKPYIVKSLEEASALTEELKERLKWLK